MSTGVISREKMFDVEGNRFLVSFGLTEKGIRGVGDGGEGPVGKQ